MADLWVLNSQIWLNKRYDGVAGYSKIVEDGITGWGTMFALTRALQHELGLSALSDNFGAGTIAAFRDKVGVIRASTKANVVGILQCALWCKGYTGGTEIGAWAEIVEVSVAAVRSDIGLGAGGVDVKVMKSLLTLDAYVRIGTGTELVRAGQRWLNSRYVGRADFFIVPCDGTFTRDVQRGLMLAIQYELGMADGVANGNFGPGTQSGLKSSAQVSSGSSDGAQSFVSLFQLALAFNTYDVPRTGTFNASTRTATLDFQRFLEITATGNGDYDTWAALLVSTGNPDRPVTGMDTTTALSASTAAARYKEGYRVVGRYLTVSGKSIAPGELDILFAAGLKLIPIFQNFNNGPEYFTKTLGLDHGNQAAVRARQLGIRGGTTIFFAVDYDAFAAEIDRLIVPYFQGVAEGLRASVSEKYAIGIYATRNIASEMMKRGLVSAVWVSGMSTGYSGNLGYPMPKDWSYNQIQELHAINIDRNAVSVRARPATRADVLPTPDDEHLTRALHWRIVEQQVFAETALEAQKQAVFSNRMANTLIFAFLMRRKYHYGPFLIYAPYPDLMPGFPSAPLARATEQYFAVAGSIADLVADYVGDMEHLGVVSQGIVYWGANAGSPSAGAGDLGGWALDVVQLWANYCKFAAGTKLEDFVSANLGGADASISEFTMEDLIADADGYLVGVDSVADKPFADSLARWLVACPEPEDRIAEFVRQRFTRPGMTLHDCIASNVDSLWHAWSWINIPRKEFQEDQRDPTVDERRKFKEACATALISRAGLSKAP